MTMKIVSNINEVEDTHWAHTWHNQYGIYVTIECDGNSLLFDEL